MLRHLNACFVVAQFLFAFVSLQIASSNNDALFNALNAGNLAEVRSALDSGANVNARSRNNNAGATPLMIAVKRGSQNAPGIVKLLLEKDADPNAVDNDGFSALHYASRLGSTELAKILLNAGADPNVQNTKDNNQTPLMACLTSSSGNLCNGQIVIALLNNSASVDLVDKNGITALDLAKGTSKPALYLSFLAGCVVQYNEECVTALVDGYQIFQHGFETLSTPVPGFTRNDETALSLSVRTGQRVIAERLLEAGSNPDKPVYTLSLAVKTGDIEMVRLLINYGVNVNAKSVNDCNRTALMECARGDGVENLCTLEIFSYLIVKRASLSEFDCNGQGIYQIASLNKVNSDFLDKLDGDLDGEPAFRAGPMLAGRFSTRPGITTRNSGGTMSRRPASFFPCGYDKEIPVTTTQQATTTRLAAGRRGPRPTHSNARTVFGTEAWYPWMARLRINFEGSKASFCGATIITANWLMTAAHCIQQPGKTLQSLEIQIGNHNWSQIESNQPDPVPARKTVVHPLYNAESFENDFALLRLNVPIVRFNNKVQPICLPDHPFRMCNGRVNMTDGALTTVDACHAVISAGWGLNENAVLTKTLQKVNLEVQPYTSCAEQLGIPVYDSMICAGSQTGEDTCQGDSGGPLMCKVNDRYVMIGVVSWGKESCGEVGIPSVYSRICKAIDWIKSVTNFDFENGNANDHGRLLGRN